MNQEREWVFAQLHPCIAKKCEHFKDGKTPADELDMFEEDDTVCSGCTVNFFELATVFKEHPCTGCSGLEFPEERRDCRGCEADMYKDDLVLDQGFYRYKDEPKIPEDFSWEERLKDFQ